MKKAVCFGEVLWDVFPDGKKAGGAPMNVAFRLQSFGYDVYMISKIGSDDLGSELFEIIATKIPTNFLQKDENIATEIVAVILDEQRNASYEIVFPSAWDFIEWNQEMEKLVSESDVFVFGSLVCRNEVSKNTLHQLLPKARYSVFDVNFRKPHYDLDEVLELMKRSSTVKMNDEELVSISEHLGFATHDSQQMISELSKKTSVETFCITCGKDGAVLWEKGNFYQHAGFEVTVEDTVGAGDNFLAALIHQIFNQEMPEKTLEFACAVGSLVASKKGPIPEIDDLEIENFILKNSL